MQKGQVQIALYLAWGGTMRPINRLLPQDVWQTAVLFVAAFVASSANAQIGPEDPMLPSKAAEFDVLCDHHDTLKIDPIVAPGQPGNSHSHEFFGNRSVSASSTPDSLRDNPDTTCGQDGADLSSYWAPSLFQHGQRVPVERMAAYYTSNRKDNLSIEPFDPNLVMIAGNKHATEAQSMTVVSWNCGKGTPHSAELPVCENGGLTLHVHFPDCWSGAVDSLDHMSHMAYAVPVPRGNGKKYCENGWTPVPRLILRFQYASTGAGGGFEFASKGIHSGHADFMNGWVGDELRDRVQRCINVPRCK